MDERLRLRQRGCRVACLGAVTGSEVIYLRGLMCENALITPLMG